MASRRQKATCAPVIKRSCDKVSPPWPPGHKTSAHRNPGKRRAGIRSAPYYFLKAFIGNWLRTKQAKLEPQHERRRGGAFRKAPSPRGQTFPPADDQEAVRTAWNRELRSAGRWRGTDFREPATNGAVHLNRVSPEAANRWATRYVTGAIAAIGKTAICGNAFACCRAFESRDRAASKGRRGCRHFRRWREPAPAFRTRR